MKTLSILLIFTLAVACQVEDAAPTTPIVNNTFDPAVATLLKTGMLVGINHTASGMASIYDSNGKKVVYLNPYSSENGPDLKIYLSKDADASEYINLGPLKSTMGMQAYDIPATVDISKYSYVHVWCEKFTVVFARAEVMEL